MLLTIFVILNIIYKNWILLYIYIIIILICVGVWWGGGERGVL